MCKTRTCVLILAKNGRLILMLNKIKKLTKNEYLQTAFVTLIIIGIIFGFWNGLQLILDTPYPLLAVASGSMCKINGPRCDGVFYPFEPTLHKGDIIVVQNVNMSTIKTGNDPIGDIIVFEKPNSISEELIVHRAIENKVINGTIYFRTKGDANSGPDRHQGSETYEGMISQELVIGKVIMRLPWFGHIALLMRNSYGPTIIIILIVLVIIVEFLLPVFVNRFKHEREDEKNIKNLILYKVFKRL